MSNEVDTKFALALDGKEFMQSNDVQSAKVIFYNLTGRNFEGDTGYPIVSHEEYLDFMQHECKVNQWTGTLTIRKSDGKVILSQVLHAKTAAPVL